jgi:VanZ family protein
VLVVASIIVLLSGMRVPALPRPLRLGPLPVDKLVHVLEFGLLALLVLRLFARGLGGLLRTSEAVVCTLLFVLCFGALDECHQSYVPGRAVELADLGADLLGGLLACLVWRLAWRRGPRGPTG